jgi:ribosomal-protein-alanine N-acetyltransferase
MPETSDRSCHGDGNEDGAPHDVPLIKNRTSDECDCARGTTPKKGRALVWTHSRYNVRVTFRVRTYQKADFETLWRIDQVCFEPKLAYSRFELAVYMRRPGAFTLVADTVRLSSEADNGNRSGQILGFIVAEYHRRTGHIITIDVMPDARRSGIGAALLHDAEKQMQAAGAMAVDLETPVNNHAAIRFYKRMGYFVEKTVSGYYSNQLDALVMRKELVGSVSV